MSKKIGFGIILTILGVIGVFASNSYAYTVNETGEYAVSFNYNIYDENGVATPASKVLRIDVSEGDVIEIGSLLTDLSFTADSPEKPKNPNSKSGVYYWKLSDGENVAVETISEEVFTGFCRTTEGVTLPKCARLEAVFADAEKTDEVTPVEKVDAGQPSMLDGATGSEIDFQKAMPTGTVLTVQELLANDTLKGEIPPTLKRILDLAVMRENGDEVEVSENEMKISLPLPEELAGYEYFQVVYIVDGEIKETFPAEVVDGKIVFTTSHLSIYGIQASNKPFTTTSETVPVAAAKIDSPDTGVESFDKSTSSSSKVLSLIVFGVSSLVFMGAMVWKKRHSHRIRL